MLRICLPPKWRREPGVLAELVAFFVIVVLGDGEHAAVRVVFARHRKVPIFVVGIVCAGVCLRLPRFMDGLPVGNEVAFPVVGILLPETVDAAVFILCHGGAFGGKVPGCVVFVGGRVEGVFGRARVGLYGLHQVPVLVIVYSGFPVFVHAPGEVVVVVVFLYGRAGRRFRGDDGRAVEFVFFDLLREGSGTRRKAPPAKSEEGIPKILRICLPPVVFLS